jgi:hypothetical protein
VSFTSKTRECQRDVVFDTGVFRTSGVRLQPATIILRRFTHDVALIAALRGILSHKCSYNSNKAAKPLSVDAELGPGDGCMLCLRLGRVAHYAS